MVAPTPELPLIRRIVADLFPKGSSLTVERATDGGSTFVYRIARGDERFYLRVLPEIGASFAPEVRAHTLLRRMGVAVPAVLAYEHLHADLGLSVMLTTEIAGEPLSRIVGQAERATILFEAGRELARINGIPVSGFGWVRRDVAVVTTLGAELPTNVDFLLGGLTTDLALLASRGLSPTERVAIEAAIGRCTALLDAPQGWLAHGDFDPTHIYARAGHYAGIIDFGEIRGADRSYDLGHFTLRDWEADRSSGVSALLAGYATVTSLPDDMARRIALSALLIGVHALARRLRKHPPLLPSADLLRGVRRAMILIAAPVDIDQLRDCSSDRPIVRAPRPLV